MTDLRGRLAGRDGGGAGRSCRPRALALGLLAVLAAAEEAPPVQAAAEAEAAEARRRGEAPAPAPARDDRANHLALRSEAAAVALVQTCDDALFLIASGRAREAVARLEPALATAGPDAEARPRALALLAEARAAEARTDVQGAADARLDAAQAARTRSGRGAEAAASLRDERLARARDLRARGHRELALAHLRALLRDLPADAEVDALFREVLDETHTARTAAIAERQRELRAEISLRVERSLIPEGFDGRPLFPDDWDERRADRRSLLEVDEDLPAWEEAIRDRLATRITVGFDATPLPEAIEVVTRIGGINLVAAPELLAAADRLITLRATGMRLEDVLAWIAEQAGTRWSLANGAVFLGEATAGTATTAIHDLGELLVGTGDFPGPRLDLTTGGGTGGAAGGFLAATEEGTPVATADDIAELIRRSVSPRTWDDAANAIVVRGSALLITAPPDVQRLVREFLRAQSAQRSLSVNVEARWLQLTDTFVEEIGVQWSNPDWSLIDAGTMGRGYVRSVDGWAVDGTTTNQLPGTAMAVNPAIAGTGLTLQSALIDSSRLTAILTAVERNAQGRVLQAPELACLNGQQASCFFGNQLAYISDYEISSSTFDPVITVLNLGVSLEARPLVSADRKFITLELQSSTATATLWTEYIVAYDTIGGAPAIFPLELPNVSIRTIGTSVMLPDRGSLLVGGFSTSLDQFAATRVPLLGSVPFLGRLFGARGRYSDKSKLFLLATATIINYPELEARL